MSNMEEGTWEHLRSLGVWHFDVDRQDDPHSHRVIAHIVTDFEELRSAVPPGRAKRLSNSMQHRVGEGSFFDRVQRGNEADAARLGLPETLTYADVFDAKGETPVGGIDRIVSALPLERAYWKLHTQRPGQIWPMHFDNYHAMREQVTAGDEWADPGVRRMWVMFTDWSWGQFIQIGNTVWSHWRKGDVLFFDWLVPHGSANCGHAERTSLVVTGVPSPDLDEWLASDAPRVITIP